MLDQLPDRLPARVTTPRLVLRRWQHSDVEVLSTVVGSAVEHLLPWMDWAIREPLTHDERVALIEEWTQSWENGQDIVMGVFLDGEAIGGTGLHRRVGPDALEIGYWIHPDHTRRGYATELTTALTTAALQLDGIETVHVHTDEGNVASAGVPAKLGFTRARVETREPASAGATGAVIIWTMDRDAWQRRDAD